MKKLLLLTFCLFAVITAQAANCPRCHGKGTICVFPKVSEYGVDSPKKHCSICNQYVYAPHYEKCGLCGGTGKSTGSGTRAERSRDAGESLRIYWSSQEYEIFKNCVGQLATGVKTYIDCSICGGSGDCKYCGGYMNVSIYAPVSSICSYCGGSGICAGCSGKGHSGIYYKMPEGEEKEQLQKAVDNLLDIAMYRRAQRNGESTTNDNSSSTTISSEDTSSSDEEGTSFWDIFYVAIAVVGIGYIVIQIIRAIFD